MFKNSNFCITLIFQNLLSTHTNIKIKQGNLIMAKRSYFSLIIKKESSKKLSHIMEWYIVQDITIKKIN